MYSTDAFAPNKQPLSEYLFWKEQAPDAITRACYLFIAGETTKFQTDLVQAGTATIGYDWVYVDQIEVSESNYAPFVLNMKQNDCGFVTFQGAVNQAVNLAKAMRQQNFTPAIYALQTNMYTPDLIALGGPDIEGAQVAVPSVLIEEIDRHPELQRYAQFLQAVKPGARPTGLGMYAWSSAALTVQILKDMGPDVTRAKFLEAVKKVNGYEGNGIIPPQNIGGKVPADCNIIVVVQGGQFKRLEPAGSGMRCDNQVATVNV